MENDKNRNNTRIAVYLIGIKNNYILLGKRKNTKHMNGYWSLPAGHVKEYESCKQAIVREIKEECGIELNQNKLYLRGAMHHFSPPFDYINYIYLIDLETYTIINNEPDKCDALMFFPMHDLPSPIENYIKFIITTTMQNQDPWIAEYGW